MKNLFVIALIGMSTLATQNIQAQEKTTSKKEVTASQDLYSETKKFLKDVEAVETKNDNIIEVGLYKKFLSRINADISRVKTLSATASETDRVSYSATLAKMEAAKTQIENEIQSTTVKSKLLLVNAIKNYISQ